jgi:hypothetical protein
MEPSKPTRQSEDKPDIEVDSADDRRRSSSEEINMWALPQSLGRLAMFAGDRRCCTDRVEIGNSGTDYRKAASSMPNKHNAARRHHISKMKFRVKNWGSMTLLFGVEAV